MSTDVCIDLVKPRRRTGFSERVNQCSAVQALPQRKQTLLFTATVTSAVQELQDHILNSPCVFKQYIGLRTTSNLREQHVRMQAHVKELYLVYILQRLQEYKVRSGMIFCGTKDTCEFIGGLLYQLKQSAVTLHSGKKQKARLGALNKVCSSIEGPVEVTAVKQPGVQDMLSNQERSGCRQAFGAFGRLYWCSETVSVARTVYGVRS